MIDDGYDDAWNKYRDDVMYQKLDVDFNDLAEVSEWIKGSATNKNDGEDTPPSYIYDTLRKIV